MHIGSLQKRLARAPLANHLRNPSAWMVGLTVAFIVLLAADPAYAAPGPFDGLGIKLKQLALGLINGVGYGATLLGGAWAVLAWMGRLGHFSTAISVFLGGIFLSQLDSLVTMLFN